MRLSAKVIALAALAVLAAIKIASSQSNAERFEEAAHGELTVGMSRPEAEQWLVAHGVKSRFYPKDVFKQNSAAANAPDAAIGALLGTTNTLDKSWLFETFVVVSVFLGADDKVIEVRTRHLTAGP